MITGQQDNRIIQQDKREFSIILVISYGLVDILKKKKMIVIILVYYPIILLSCYSFYGAPDMYITSK